MNVALQFHPTLRALSRMASSTNRSAAAGTFETLGTNRVQFLFANVKAKQPGLAALASERFKIFGHRVPHQRNFADGLAETDFEIDHHNRHEKAQEIDRLDIDFHCIFLALVGDLAFSLEFGGANA